MSTAIAVRRMTPLRKMLNLAIATVIEVLVFAPAAIAIAVAIIPLLLVLTSIGLRFPAQLEISGKCKGLLERTKRCTQRQLRLGPDS